MACTTCREKNVGRWIVAEGWHDGIVLEYGRQVSNAAWKKWTAKNPPFDIDWDDEE